MLLRLKYKFKKRLDRGWDPVSPQYAASYAEKEAEAEAEAKAVIGSVENLTGSVRGKRLLDLGGGPGQFSVRFAAAGADVTWHDPSRTYMNIAAKAAEAAGVKINFSLGYLEDAAKFSSQPFDIIFNRVCWYYSCGDDAFACLIHSITRPGGLIHVTANTSLFYQKFTPRLRFALRLNRCFRFKLDHIHPPRGRITDCFHRLPVRYLCADYRSATNDTVVIIK